MFFTNKLYVIIMLSCFLPLYALTEQDEIGQNVVRVADSLYDSKPDFISKETTLQKDKTELQMMQEQTDLMRKEFHGNPAKSDIIYHKQEIIKQQIQNDSTLKINPEISEQPDIIGVTQQYEFVVQYVLKIVDEIPYGEEYKISIPLHSLNLKKSPTRTCQVQTKEHYLTLTLYNHYTQAEMKSSIRKQTQYLLYNLLRKYQAEVVECIMLNQVHLDDMNTAINSQSRTKTITSVHSYMLVDFHGGILTLQIFNPPKK